MVVLINAYSGVLTSLLTAPRLKPIAQTLKDVAESKVLRVSCEKNSFFSQTFLVLLISWFSNETLFTTCKPINGILFQNAAEGYEKILGDQLRNDPTFLVSDGVAAYENVIHHKAAYPGVQKKMN